MQISAGNLDTPPARYDASLLIWQLYIHIYIYTYIPNTYTYVFILFFLSFFLLLARASPTYYVSISHVTLTQISVPHAPPATLLSFFIWVRAGEPDISRAVYGASTQTWPSRSAGRHFSKVSSPLRLQCKYDCKSDSWEISAHAMVLHRTWQPHSAGRSFSTVTWTMISFKYQSSDELTFENVCCSPSVNSVVNSEVNSISKLSGKLTFENVYQSDFGATRGSFLGSHGQQEFN